MEPWTLPVANIRENDTCELCDERALPYNVMEEEGYCAEHRMAWETGWALEDYADSNAEDERRYLLSQMRISVTDKGACCVIGCEHNGFSRHEGDSTLIACTECAAVIFFAAIVLDRETWVEILTDEILES